VRLAVLKRPAVQLVLLLVSSTGFEVAAQDADRPDIVLTTPNTIRIQSLDDPTKGHWVAMPSFGELGSPTFSRDGRWIAFDAYKHGFDNSRAECWIARKVGRELKRLAFGATPRFSPDGSRLLFYCQKTRNPLSEWRENRRSGIPAHVPSAGFELEVPGRTRSGSVPVSSSECAHRAICDSGDHRGSAGIDGLRTGERQWRRYGRSAIRLTA
jgi:dipeptidyl aminopeptidase/acylaminoacyl peptidase